MWQSGTRRCHGRSHLSCDRYASVVDLSADTSCRLPGALAPAVWPLQRFCAGRAPAADAWLVPAQPRRRLGGVHVHGSLAADRAVGFAVWHGHGWNIRGVARPRRSAFPEAGCQAEISWTYLPWCRACVVMAVRQMRQHALARSRTMSMPKLGKRTTAGLVSECDAVDMGTDAWRNWNAFNEENPEIENADDELYSDRHFVGGPSTHGRTPLLPSSDAGLKQHVRSDLPSDCASVCTRISSRTSSSTANWSLPIPTPTTAVASAMRSPR